MENSTGQLVAEPTFEVGTSLLRRRIIHYNPQSSVMNMFLTLYVWRLMFRSKRKLGPISDSISVKIIPLTRLHIH
jgi:hypothetical protein